jgi:hypothetical protein
MFIGIGTTESESFYLNLSLLDLVDLYVCHLAVSLIFNNLKK